MSVGAGFSRDQLRQAYSTAWKKHLGRVPLTAQEVAIADVIALHPEYQALIEDPESALAFEPGAASGRQNPFLHMGLHLAVRDQLKLDRPPGVLGLFQQLQARLGDTHSAEHRLMEALGDVLWQASRDGRAPDEQRYMALARERLKP
jgi:Domain of unknown function (DUF1841)